MNGHMMTDRGQVRTTNEDAGGIFNNRAKQILAIVADGMGGHQAGEVASQLAVAFAEEKWTQSEEIKTPIEAEEWLQRVLIEMNETIYTMSQEKDIYEGMGTTVVITICTDEFVTIAHIGDSRCYMINDEKLELLTNDHSLVNELIRTGQITESDAEQHPRKNVLLKAVGTETTVSPDIKSINWDEDHSVFLCSDGLTNKISAAEIENYVRTYNDLKKLGTDLISLANERGGEDNITFAIVQNMELQKEGDLPC